MIKDNIEDRVLALKYRPKRFEDLIGQSTVSQTLSLALESNRLSHAYLFSGLRGSGKTSTARIMAKALLCSNGPTAKPCEVCDNCLSTNANKHLDVIEMDAASNRGIDDIKDLIEHTKYKPSSARYKVFIIDEVHMLTTPAFNALLKTLEEPPAFVKFILATTDALKLPATILSRTQHFRFNKISQNDVVHHLSHILHEEKIDFEKEALEILSRSGQGSLRDTLTLLDQAIIFSKSKVQTRSVVEMLGLIEPQKMEDIFKIVLNKGDINTILKDLEVYEVTQIIDEMTLFLKDKMITKDIRFDMLLFDRFFRVLSDAKHLLAINSDGGFVLILTFMKLMEATTLRSIDDIINQVEKMEARNDEKAQVRLEKASELIPEVIVEQKIELKPEAVVQIVPETIEIKEEIKSETLPYLMENPFDIKEEVRELAPALIEETIVETNSYYDPSVEVEIVPFEDESDESDDMYIKLTQRVYDRDYELGELFEKNFIFSGFAKNTLYIISYAKDEERKLLYKHFGLIKTFAQDIFGKDVELDFKKEEATILSAPTFESKETNNNTQIDISEENQEFSNGSDDVGSMIEDIEMSAGCVADLTQSSVVETSQKEFEINDVLNSKMLDKVKELFDIRKITVKSRS